MISEAMIITLYRTQGNNQQNNTKVRIVGEIQRRCKQSYRD